jgi:DNA polymerase-3 subunit epsilon
VSTPWWQAPWLVLDFESTGVDIETARTVQVALVHVNADGMKWHTCRLVNSGVDIPEEAQAVHGISTERAQREGHDPREVIEDIAARISTGWSHGHPLIAMNAGYDVSLLDRELRRLTGSGFKLAGPVIDPLVIDRHVEPYRKGSGARKLERLAQIYGVPAGNAHDALGDCLTAARVVWRQSRRYREIADMGLRDLHAAQMRWHASWARGFEAYLHTKAEPRQPDAVIDTAWPLRPISLTTSGVSA